MFELFPTERQSSNLINFEKKKKNFKADLFFHALRQNLVKIEKPKFNEKVGFMGFLLAKKIFWINAYHTALMQFNSLQ